MKKYSLTEEHRAQLKPWADKWIASTMSCKKMDDEDKQKMIVAINGMYDAAKLERPKNIVFAPSPIVAAIAGSIAAGVWHLRKNLKLFNHATNDATRDATLDATRDATYEATHDATRDATYDATYEATYDATRAATNDATYEATYEAIREETYEATNEATRAVIDAATRAATNDATNDATNISSIKKFESHKTKVKFLTLMCERYYSFWNGGNQWGSWVSYLSFFRHVVKLELKEYEAFQHYENAAIHGGPRFMHKDFCIVSDRPEFIHVNEKNQPHCETGAFCRWRDGTELYYLNGVKMKKEHVMTPSNKLDPLEILKEENVEVRRELIRKIGIERFMQVIPNKVLDKRDGYELLSIELTDEIKDARFLKMINPSVGTFHVEGVAPECSTVQAALNWRSGQMEEDWEPSVLT